MVDRVVGFARAHPELVMFAVGLLLFSGGVLSVMTGFFDRGDDPSVVMAPQVAERSPKRDVVGPTPAEDLAVYVPARQQALKDLSIKDPRASSYAVVSFDPYMKVAEADQFFKTRKMQVSHVFFRIPLAGFEPQESTVTSTIGDATRILLGKERIDELNEEVAALEEILPQTQDPAYRAVYAKNIENMRKGIALLQQNPSVIYGVVVKSTNANLAKLAGAQGVRLVDVSDDPGASFGSHDFVAIMPEATDRA